MQTAWIWTTAALVLVFGLAACAGPTPKKNTVPSKYGPLPKGCSVQVFSDAPDMATDQVGRVNARCQSIVSEDDCMRELMDQACALGANVVWGVSEEDKQARQPSGRAAHTK